MNVSIHTVDFFEVNRIFCCELKEESTRSQVPFLADFSSSVRAVAMVRGWITFLLLPRLGCFLP